MNFQPRTLFRRERLFDREQAILFPVEFQTDDKSRCVEMLQALASPSVARNIS
jgi:hypothetical protein